MARPLLLFSITFVIGTYVGTWWPFSLLSLLLFAGLALLGAALAALWRRECLLWLLLLTCLAAGMLNLKLFDVGHSSSLTDWQGERVTVVGRVVQEPDVRPDKVYYVLDLERITASGKTTATGGLLRLTVHKPEQIFCYGEVIEARGLLQRAEQPGNPGQFDYRRYLARRGIHVTMSLWQPDDVRSLGLADGGVLGWALKAKKHFNGVLVNTLSPTHSALMQGMLFGSYGMIAKEITSAFQITSLVHILSVSGFHVSLVLGALLLVLNLFKVPRRVQAPLCTVMIFFYAAMTGMGPAVLRASIMGLMVLWARHVGRERDWPTAMALAGAVVLFIWPYGLWEPGFQLSFAVTWGILYFVPRIVQNTAGGHPWLLAALAVPVVAEITALPLVAYHFNMVSLVGVVANVLTGPIITAAMLLSGLSVPLGLLYLPLAALINISTGMLLDVMLWIVNILANLPRSVVYVASPPKAAVMLFYVLLLLAPLLAEKRPFNKRTLAKAILVLVGLLALILLPPSNEQHLTVHFIDVGQGDAVLLQTPAGKNMLIDAGGWRGELETGQGAGSGVVLPYLKRQAINRLDVLMLSHPHEDHVGGVKAVMQHLPVGLAVVAPVDKNHPEVEQSYWALLDELAQVTTVRQGWAGHRLQLDDQLQIKILSPPKGGAEGLNNASLVLKVSYRQISFLFTGDIEKEGQQMLAAGRDDLRAHILKVPHHGSGNMAVDFYQRVNPKLAVISVGKNNGFGHPAPVLLELLMGNDTRVYRTDLHGAIIIKTDGQSIWVDTGGNNAR